MYSSFYYGDGQYGDYKENELLKPGECGLNINNYLPRVVRNIEEYEAINKSISHELCWFYSRIANTKEQFDLSSATWALNILEGEVGINNANLEHKDRIMILQARWRGRETTTIELIKNIAEEFSGGVVKVTEHYNKYMFEIKFIGQKGVPKNLDALKKQLDIIKPSHLGYKFEFILITYGMLNKDLEVKHGEPKEEKITYRMMKEYRVNEIEVDEEG